jgi:hypothetical protein
VGKREIKGKGRRELKGKGRREIRGGEDGDGRGQGGMRGLGIAKLHKGCGDFSSQHTDSGTAKCPHTCIMNSLSFPPTVSLSS